MWEGIRFSDSELDPTKLLRKFTLKFTAICYRLAGKRGYCELNTTVVGWCSRP